MVWNKEAQKSHLFEDFKAKEGAHHLEVYSTATSRGKGQTLGYLYQGKYGDSLPQLALPQQSQPGHENAAWVAFPRPYWHGCSSTLGQFLSPLPSVPSAYKYPSGFPQREISRVEGLC